ncbi:S-layer homology domain-containing protein [Caldanaerobius fijiensis DSM 17918]|uniref:S-layer homology domain-containing protein n=1 Tax=Caldanaerobius fijiensis DSM 17918 TaxID=1121256 RepID=A0A1M5AHF0_9THEO|nr:S-layer homology domain-containing protein [Caldanaerobius fijiensis]SHF29342.1 S-layer homology domain-containing protein [Caldanaerobius fijiensis DSM 17918]
MRSFKKALAFVLTVALVLSSMMVFAFADTNTSTYPDVNGTDYATAVNALTSLGVVSGYPDGTFGVNDNLNRAQVAKMIVLTLGLGNAADNAKSISKFSDVKPGDWFAGYVNVAASLGIVKGYGNGKFGPNDNVTYPQVLIMLIRALGYKDSDVITSPDNYILDYIVKAGQLGITDGVTVNTGVATRGDTAKLFYNALSANIVTGRNTDGSPIVSETKTLLTKLASVATYTVLSTPSVDSSVSAGYVVTDKGSILTDINLDAYLGKTIEVYTTGTPSKIIALKSIDTYDTSVKTFTTSDNGKVTQSVNGNVYSYKFEDPGITVSDIPTVFDGVKTTLSKVYNNIDKNSNVTLIDYNNDGTYEYAIVKDATAGVTPIVVQNNVPSGASYIDNIYSINDSNGNAYKVQGAVTSAYDIKAGDVVYKVPVGPSASPSTYVYYVVRNKVSGTISQVSFDGSTLTATINGTSYTVKTSEITTSSVGAQGTATLNKNGEIISWSGTSSTTTTNYGIVTAVQSFSDQWNTKVQLNKPDGTTAVYDAVYDDITSGAVVKPVTVPSVVYYTLDSTGKIDSMNMVNVVQNYTVNSVDTSNNVVTINNTPYYVNSSTQIFTYDSVNKTITPVKFTDLANLSGATVYAMDAPNYNILSYLILNSSQITTSNQPLVYVTGVNTVYTSAGQYKSISVFDKNGVSKTYNTAVGNTSINVSAGNVYVLTLDVKGNVTNATPAASASGYTVKTGVTNVTVDYTNNGIKYTENNTPKSALLDPSVFVVDKSDTAVSALGNIDSSSSIDLYFNSVGKVAIIVIP